eukprot:3505576-Alexandrium_andersonii.AAC.1
MFCTKGSVHEAPPEYQHGIACGGLRLTCTTRRCQLRCPGDGPPSLSKTSDPAAIARAASTVAPGKLQWQG